jgi:hypothetical protein
VGRLCGAGALTPARSITFASLVLPLILNRSPFREFHCQFRVLIHVKDAANAPIHGARAQFGGIKMPTETAIMIAGIVLVFAVFAISLAWVDFFTRDFRAPGATYFDERAK